MTLHFAYGSNMSRAGMRARCGSAREIGTGLLAGYRFIITADGYASVLPAPGGIVHGLVWRLTPRDLAALDAYESLDTGLYRAVTLPVRIGSAHAPALVYVGRSRVAGRPRPGYLEEVLAAARDLSLPPAYLRKLARWASGGPGREAVA
jgi:gamma-glutamylcyclotransferase (GGCT)/AIG2-like uncharacterized protein YtfP